MQAVQYTDHGGREVGAYDPLPDPEPGPGTVLVDVRAGAPNHLDVWTRNGLPGLDLDLPHVPESDAAGVVEAVGGDTWADSLRTLAGGGRLVTCGATMATADEVDDVLAKVWGGTYEVRVRETLPMSETARAHRLLEDREGFGKVVVVPNSEYSS